MSKRLSLASNNKTQGQASGKVRCFFWMEFVMELVWVDGLQPKNTIKSRQVLKMEFSRSFFRFMPG